MRDVPKSSLGNKEQPRRRQAIPLAVVLASARRCALDTARGVLAGEIGRVLPRAREAIAMDRAFLKAASGDQGQHGPPAHSPLPRSIGAAAQMGALEKREPLRGGAH
jgi:hypothetical protein